MQQIMIELHEELERACWAAFCKSMSDDFCYTNGTIYPLQRRVRELETDLRNYMKVITSN